MKRQSSELDASYRFCRQVTRCARSSFAPGMWLLPPHQRRGMDAIYAFMRHTDDLGDRPAPREQRQAALASWRSALDDCLAGKPVRTESDETASRMLPAVADTLVQFQIPVECLYDAIEGQEMDLQPRLYDTFADLEVYCEKVAATVGIACLHVWGLRDGSKREPGRRVAIAFQLTNILRDVREDLQRGRIYLPQADLANFGLTNDDLRAGRTDRRFCDLVAMEVLRARELYGAAAELSDALLPSGRRALRMLCAVYQQLLDRIGAHPEAILSKRVRLGRLEKWWLAAAAWFC